MIKYIKESIFNSLSWIGVFFLVIAIYFAADSGIKSYNDRKELSYREKTEGVFTEVSDIRKKHESRHNGNGTNKYYQDFIISYKYNGKEYSKKYENFYFSSQKDGYKKGAKEYIYVNKNNPNDAIIASRFNLDYTFAKQIFIMFGVPGIVIILFPKKNKNEEK